MKSEVELNKSLLQVNDVLYYTDNDNCEKYIVIDKGMAEFTAINVETELPHWFEFSGLQHGWSISEKTKQKHIIEDKFNYIQL